MTNYEAVPDDVELQKVTAGESAALSRYKRHENINTFLANENVPVVIGGLIATYLGVRLAEDIIGDLESRVGKLSEDVKQGIKDTIEIKLPTLVPAPVAPASRLGKEAARQISDLVTYIKKEIG